MTADISAPSDTPAVDDATSRRSHRDRVTHLVSAEASALLRYFARRLNQPDDAADLLGETLVVIWRRAAVIPPHDEEARMWIYGVARNVLASHIRSSVRRRALTDQLKAELAAVPATAELDGNPEDLDVDRAEQVRIVIGGLRPIDREIVRLVHWEGFSLREVATMMGMPPATIRSRYARARRRLQRSLAES